MRMTRLLLAAAAAFAFSAVPATAKAAPQCSNTGAGFDAWVVAFKQEAAGQWRQPFVLDRAFANVTTTSRRFRADRGQKSFKLSFDQFMQKRGGQAIISRGKKMKRANAALFNSIERKYGVPAGPLIAIWGMETGFGSYMGKEHTLSAVSTLSFDCRRSDYFTDQLYAALSSFEGFLSPAGTRRSPWRNRPDAVPAGNVVKFGADGDGDGRVDMVGSKADALASTANFLRVMAGSPAPAISPAKPTSRPSGLERRQRLPAGNRHHRRRNRRRLISSADFGRTASAAREARLRIFLWRWSAGQPSGADCRLVGKVLRRQALQELPGIEEFTRGKNAACFNWSLKKPLNGLDDQRRGEGIDVTSRNRGAANLALALSDGLHQKNLRRPSGFIGSFRRRGIDVAKIAKGRQVQKIVKHACLQMPGNQDRFRKRQLSSAMAMRRSSTEAQSPIAAVASRSPRPP
jgi:hypothetical protein